MPGAPAKPKRANFYPEGATKAEVEKWINSLRRREKAQATGFFTTIRRGPDGKLHRRSLQHRISGRAGDRRAAFARGGRATTQPTLKAFLEARAEAFVSTTTTTAT